MTERGHVFIEVLNRRWCVGCQLFQMKSGGFWDAFRTPQFDCPRNTPYARAVDDLRSRNPNNPSAG